MTPLVTHPYGEKCAMYLPYTHVNTTGPPTKAHRFLLLLKVDTKFREIKETYH